MGAPRLGLRSEAGRPPPARHRLRPLAQGGFAFGPQLWSPIPPTLAGPTWACGGLGLGPPTPPGLHPPWPKTHRPERRHPPAPGFSRGVTFPPCRAARHAPADCPCPRARATRWGPVYRSPSPLLPSRARHFFLSLNKPSCSSPPGLCTHVSPACLPSPRVSRPCGQHLSTL